MVVVVVVVVLPLLPVAPLALLMLVAVLPLGSLLAVAPLALPLRARPLVGVVQPPPAAPLQALMVAAELLLRTGAVPLRVGLQLQAVLVMAVPPARAPVVVVQLLLLQQPQAVPVMAVLPQQALVCDAIVAVAVVLVVAMVVMGVVAAGGVLWLHLLRAIMRAAVVWVGAVLVVAVAVAIGVAVGGLLSRLHTPAERRVVGVAGVVTAADVVGLLLLHLLRVRKGDVVEVVAVVVELRLFLPVGGQQSSQGLAAVCGWVRCFVCCAAWTTTRQLHRVAPWHGERTAAAEQQAVPLAADLRK